MSLHEIDELGNFKMLEQSMLGNGGTSRVYKCTRVSRNNGHNNDIYAIKIEKIKTSSKIKEDLHTEYKILSYLKGGIGIPQIYSYFQTTSYKCLIMELLDKNLQDIFIQKNKNFSLQTIKSLGIQILMRIEFLHSKNLIHCDIKPQNLALGIGKNKNLVYLIDFGNVKKYISSSTKKHIKWKESEIYTRMTLNFCSINSQMNYTLSRRDDLISFMYTIIYFFRGNLPWSLQMNEEDVLNMKIDIDDKELCFGLPKNILIMWKYIVNLKFEEMPNYQFLFKNLYELTDNNNVYELCL